MTHSHQFFIGIVFFLDMDNDTTTKADFATEFCHPSDENEHSKHEVFDEDIWGKDEDFYVVADPIENPNGNPDHQPSRQYDKDFPMLSSTSQGMDFQPLITNPRPNVDPQRENLAPVSLHNNSASSHAIKDPEIEYIILDTNVLILDLNYVLFIIRDFKQFKIFLPWQVLQEIGDLEKRPLPQLAQKARIASRFLEEYFHEIEHQNGEQEYQIRRTFRHQCNDDKILQTILNLRDVVGRKVKFWCYDRNLVTKARTFQIDIFMNAPSSYESATGKFCN